MWSNERFPRRAERRQTKLQNQADNKNFREYKVSLKKVFISK